MTGSNTDRVETAAYVRAGSILLRIAAPLFQAWKRAKTDDPMDMHINAWFTLRKTAEVFLERRHTKLTRADRDAMVAALKVAHDLEHDADIDDAPPVDVCPCAVSEDVRDLVGLMLEGEKAGAVAA
jgi:hypothetical protein